MPLGTSLLVCLRTGFVPYEKGCLRKTVVQPIPLCPDTFHASSDAGDLLCTRNVGEKPQWSCQAGVADDDGVCADRQLSPPSITCPNGFVLQQVGEPFASAVRVAAASAASAAAGASGATWVAHKLIAACSGC